MRISTIIIFDSSFQIDGATTTTP